MNIETYEQRLARQVELEKEMVGMGTDRYNNRRSKEDEANMPPARLLLRQTVHKVSDAIEEWAESVLNSSAARRGGATCKAVKEAGYQECAVLALRTCINNIKPGNKYQTICFEVANAVEKMLEYRDFQTNAPLQHKWAIKDMEKKGNERQREKIIDHKRHEAGVGDRGWTKEFQINLGVRLVEIVIESTGFFAKDLKWLSGKESQTYLIATESLLKWLDKQHHDCALLQPFNLPLLIEPKEWTTPFDGGYYTSKNTLLKTDDKKHLQYLETDPEKLEGVYNAVNALQNTRWRINTKVLDVMQALWDIGGDRAKLPPRLGRELPVRPEEVDEDPALLKIWKGQMREVYDYNHRITGKVSGIAQKLMIAEKFREEECLHFAYQCDWRGRAYPIGTALHPQGDDSSKALLEFADGMPLGEDGAGWLFVHIANSWGYDKAGYEARIQWVKDHSRELLDYATDPLEYQGWTEAGDPFLFLAACFDYLGWYVHGNAYVSHLPIQVDGTCNGLQNYSAMLRDAVGGAATNLVPSDKPSDIYQTVANKSNELIAIDRAKGVEEAVCLPVGIVTRQLAKRNTMTVPYAATLYGMRDQLMSEFDKMKEDGTLSDMKGLTIAKAATYIATKNQEAISSTVIAASKAMAWLQEAVKIASEHTDVIQWTTPVGLTVKQCYMKAEYKRVKIIVGAKEQKVLIKKEGTKLNSKKQVAGIAPNFIHSCDASHMMKTINGGLKAGIQHYSFIHDSFGTHAANMTELSIVLREQFVKQYTPNVLAYFRLDLINSILEAEGNTMTFTEASALIPETPLMGDLELSKVIESYYFFA